MIRLIITANDRLYDSLSAHARAEGDTPQRAVNVVDGFKQATTLAASPNKRVVSVSPAAGRRLSAIVVDMALHAADTLVETLHSRQITAHVPVLAVKCDTQLLPVALRRLCAEILDADTLCPADTHRPADTQRPADAQHPADARHPPEVAPHSIGKPADALG